jgi:hypothetical protein
MQGKRRARVQIIGADIFRELFEKTSEARRNVYKHRYMLK